MGEYQIYQMNYGLFGTPIDLTYSLNRFTAVFCLLELLLASLLTSIH